MKRNLFPLLGIAFVVALAASGVFYGVFVSQLRQVSNQKAQRRIVVAARPIDSGTSLSPADLKLLPWSGEPPPGGFKNINALQGRTLYTPVVENEPLTEAQFSAEKASGGLGLKKGMRALSVHVYDSSGLLPFLSAGQRVDLQVVQSRGRPDAVLKTILQNVEVLGVAKPEANQFANNPAVVTVLVSPENADAVALADSAANIRILLRNIADREERSRPSVTFASLLIDAPAKKSAILRDGSVAAIEAAAPVRAVRAALAPAEQAVDFLVQIMGASSGAMDNIQTAGLRRSTALSLPKGDAGDRLRESIQRQSVVLSSRRVRASNLHQVYFETGKRWPAGDVDFCALTVRLRPRITADRGLHLRLQPELTIPDGNSGVVARRAVAELDLDDGQSVIVTGLADPRIAPALIDELFGNQVAHAEIRELILMITPEMVTPRMAGSADRVANR